MAHKVKCMPTNAEQEKMRQENKERAKRMKPKKATKWEKSKQEKEQKDKDKKIKSGLKALKEIKKYQSGTKLLIKRLPFQRVIKELCKRQRKICDFNLQQ